MPKRRTPAQTAASRRNLQKARAARKPVGKSVMIAQGKRLPGIKHADLKYGPAEENWMSKRNGTKPRQKAFEKLDRVNNLIKALTGQPHYAHSSNTATHKLLMAERAKVQQLRKKNK